MLHAATDPELRPGVFNATIATAEPELYSSERIQPAASSFGPLAQSVAVGRGMTLETASAGLRPVEPPVEKPADPMIDDWLQEVTEPYMLWDSPKPLFDFPTDYFYDFAEPLPQLHMPLYVQPLVASPRRIENPCSLAISRLSKDRLLFTLSPEAVRLRAAR
jgi:hypothetical protein